MPLSEPPGWRKEADPAANRPAPSFFRGRLHLFARILSLAALVMAGGCADPTIDGAGSVDDWRYDERLWDRLILAILEEGTRVVASDSVFAMAPPPANSGRETTGELVYLEALSETMRTPEILKMIEFENSGASIGEIFANGGYFVPEANVGLKNLLDTADHDMRYFTVKYKKQYLRPRPITLQPTLRPAIATPSHPAYPSGHGGQAWLAGLILSSIDPENRDRYLQFARSVGFRREIAGVHYPSDSAQGRWLADQVFRKLLANEMFARQLAEAGQAYIGPDLAKAYVVTEFAGQDGSPGP